MTALTRARVLSDEQKIGRLPDASADIREYDRVAAPLKWTSRVGYARAGREIRRPDTHNHTFALDWHSATQGAVGDDAAEDA